MTKGSRPARCIRSYYRVADKFHDCHYCRIPIMPGEMYHAEVWVQDRKLKVRKYHHSCPEDPHDEEERIKREIEEQEKSEPESEEMDMAA